MIPKFGRPHNSSDLEELHKTIERENQVFEEQRQNLIKELSYLIHEKELLKEKVKKTEAQLKESLTLRHKIANQLYESYIISVEKSANTIKAVEDTVRDLKDLLEIKKAELERLKGYIKKMKEEFLGIAGRYENILEKEEQSDYEYEWERQK